MKQKKTIDKINGIVFDKNKRRHKEREYLKNEHACYIV